MLNRIEVPTWGVARPSVRGKKGGRRGRGPHTKGYRFQRLPHCFVLQSGSCAVAQASGLSLAHLARWPHHPEQEEGLHDAADATAEPPPLISSFNRAASRPIGRLSPAIESPVCATPQPGRSADDHPRPSPARTSRGSPSGPSAGALLLPCFGNLTPGPGALHQRAASRLMRPHPQQAPPGSGWVVQATAEACMTNSINRHPARQHRSRLLSPCTTARPPACRRPPQPRSSRQFPPQRSWQRQACKPWRRHS